MSDMDSEEQQQGRPEGTEPEEGMGQEREQERREREQREGDLGNPDQVSDEEMDL